MLSNVLALFACVGRIGLNVNADHPSLRAALLKARPLGKRLRRAAAEATVNRRVNPRFVIRDVDDEIARRAPLV
jgi:hypothetical protein